MPDECNQNVQGIIGTIEVYLENEIDSLKKKLESLKKINTEQLTQELCSDVEISSAQDEKEIINALLELIKV